MTSVVFTITNKATGKVVRVLQKAITVKEDQEIQIAFVADSTYDAFREIDIIKRENGLLTSRAKTKTVQLTIDEQHPITKVRRRLATIV